MTVYYFLLTIIFFQSYSELQARNVAEKLTNYLTEIRHTPIPEVQEEINATAHFEFPHIKKYCNVSNWDAICKSNATIVCTERQSAPHKMTGRVVIERKVYQNWCYLFLSNMCENPGREFNIVSDGDCESYLAARRNNNPDGKTTEAGYNTSLGTTGETEATTYTLAAHWPKYKALVAFDDHLCALTCPELYAPICLNINRGYGKDMKVLTFKNHCLGDQYYCKHPEEFRAPKGSDYEELPVQASDISWSFCAASRYISFARFTETATSMAHYGWLAGDHTARHILSPDERIAGFG